MGIFRILTYIWQFPQNIIGWLWLKTTKQAKRFDWEGKKCYFYDVFQESSFSMGDYIFIAYRYETTIRHEYGHHCQSLYLGPLYFLLIGLPSIIGYWIDIWFHNNWSEEDRDKWYYNLPWEKWADKLGGVKRFTK